MVTPVQTSRCGIEWGLPPWYLWISIHWVGLQPFFLAGLLLVTRRSLCQKRSARYKVFVIFWCDGSRVYTSDSAGSDQFALALRRNTTKQQDFLSRWIDANLLDFSDAFALCNDQPCSFAFVGKSNRAQALSFCNQNIGCVKVDHKFNDWKWERHNWSKNKRSYKCNTPLSRRKRIAWQLPHCPVSKHQQQNLPRKRAKRNDKSPTTVFQSNISCWKGRLNVRYPLHEHPR